LTARLLEHGALSESLIYVNTPTPNPGNQAAIRLLLIEDNPDDAFLLRELLRGAPVPFEIEETPWLAAGLERLNRGGIDVVMSDLSLPDGNGIDTFRKLAAHPARVPIIVLSGLHDEAMALRTVEEGAQDYLVKGNLERDLVVRSVRYAMKRAAADRALEDERNLLRRVIDSLPDSIYVKDAEGRYLLGNLAHTHQLGLASPGQAVGQTSASFFPEDVARGFKADDAQVMKTGQPIVNRHESVGEGHGALQWLSTTKVPLRDAQGAIIGIIGIGRDITARKNAEEKLARYTEELREKNAEMEDDLDMAREVQQAFLPQQFPSFPQKSAPEESALRFVSKYLPTEALGGDFFHVSAISDTQAAVFICDVMGHGVRAALVTAIQRTLVEELQPTAHDPGEFLTQMNRALLSILRRTRSPMFASAFYLVADVVTGEMRYANAGHPRPLHLRRSAGKVSFLDGGNTRPGPALGVFDGTVYRTFKTPIVAQDLVLLFTDGLYEVESKRGELYDQTLLLRAVERRLYRPTEEIFEETIGEVREFSATRSFEDDVCLVGMEVVRTGTAAPGEQYSPEGRAASLT
jgi:sigma-B regulation protein RsbU (phosphoserine phosphatase)